MNIALIAGNGLTIDFCSAHGIARDPSGPFTWEFNVPNSAGISWKTAFPELAQAMASDEDIQSLAAFDALLQRRATMHGGRQIEVDAEARQFLAFAYSVLQQDIDAIGLDHWRWVEWLRRYAVAIRAAISFNYDLLLEGAFRRVGLRPWRPAVRGEDSGTFFLKPHGSIDFECDPRGISMDPSQYPLLNWATLNDTPLIALEQTQLYAGRQEAFIVLPTEYSPYLNYQWVKPGYDAWRREAHVLTHCVFIGISDWVCDQPELNAIIHGLGPSTAVIVANPNPPNSFVDRVAATGRPCIVWDDGPEDVLVP